MKNEYVTKLKNGAYRIAGTRISLDSVVYAFWRGESPESIVDSFADLTLEQTYGAIAYYLAHQSDIDAYLTEGDAEFEKLRQSARKANPLRPIKLPHCRSEAI